MRNKTKITASILALSFLSIAATGEESCYKAPQQSASGVSAITQKVMAGADGLTTEQRNVRERLVQDNKPGAIQHLYIISAYSGQVLLYSTVRGKVTSSGKRLTPSLVTDGAIGAFRVDALSGGGGVIYTDEVLGDDGTYGSSVEYIYWWDSQGIYHQHYVQGGQIVHVASAPIAVKSVVLNLESRTAE